MVRQIFGLLFCLLPGIAPADVTCTQMQAAMRVPPPASGESKDPDGPLGCTHEALLMFEINRIAQDRAEPVTDPADLHGAWLGDRVLSYVAGITVQGRNCWSLRRVTDPRRWL